MKFLKFVLQTLLQVVSQLIWCICGHPDHWFTGISKKQINSNFLVGFWKTTMFYIVFDGKILMDLSNLKSKKGSCGSHEIFVIFFPNATQSVFPTHLVHMRTSRLLIHKDFKKKINLNYLVGFSKHHCVLRCFWW